MRLLGILGIVLLLSCKPYERKTVPVSHLQIDTNAAGLPVFFFHDTIFNGSAVQQFPGEQGHFNFVIRDGLIQHQFGYYYSGALERDFPFTDGLEDGVLTMYYENGDKYIEEHFSMGQLHGMTRTWDKNKRLVAHSEYRDGKLVKSLKGDTK